MKEIKFRGKRVDNRQWVYGFFTIGLDCFYIEDRYDLPPTMFDPGGDAIIIRDEVDHETVGRYTGIKDKNGQEIYEGDIVDIGQAVNGCSLFSVEWDRYRWSVRYAIKMDSPRLYEYNLEEFFDLKNDATWFDPVLKIVGNIHENSELVK